MQAHGRTADIDRPLCYRADRQTTPSPPSSSSGSKRPTSSALAWRPASPCGLLSGTEMVRKLVLASVTYRFDGVHPGLMEVLGRSKPEMMHGSPWHEEYVR